MKTVLGLVLIAAAWSCFPSLLVGPAEPCEEQAAATTSVVGAVIAVDKTAKTVTLKIDDGTTVSVVVTDATVSLRIAAGAKTLDEATAITFEAVSVGDRLLARGTRKENELAALRIVVLTSADIVKKRELDLEAWRQRGISGIVKCVNTQAAIIEIDLRGTTSPTPILIQVTGAEFRRYSAQAINFEDARTGSISDLAVGDQLRALGEKTADGQFKAEAVVSGSFKTIGATITGIDNKTGELKATSLDKKTPIMIATLKASAIHRIPVALVPTIAQKAASRPPTARSNGSDLQQLIDSLPKIAVSDLKVGDVVSVTGVRDTGESRMVGIKLVAGIDAVLRAMSTPGRPQTVRLSAGLPTAFDFSVIQ